MAKIWENEHVMRCYFPDLWLGRAASIVTFLMAVALPCLHGARAGDPPGYPTDQPAEVATKEPALKGSSIGMCRQEDILSLLKAKRKTRRLKRWTRTFLLLSVVAERQSEKAS